MQCNANEFCKKPIIEDVDIIHHVKSRVICFTIEGIILKVNCEKTKNEFYMQIYMFYLSKRSLH